MGGDLRAPGARSPHRCPPQPRARLAGPPDLRAGVGLPSAGGRRLMQDRPTAPELLEAVAEYLFAELRPEVPREQRFKVLVAANVCAVVAREIRAGDEADRQDLALFGELLGEEVSDIQVAASELSRRLRSGELDDRIDELAPRLEEHVRRKLEIARPGYDQG